MSILPSPSRAIVVVAAGSGTRLGAGVPKAFVGIDEHTVLRHALRGVFAAPLAQVVVVVPAGRTGEAVTEIDELAGERRPLVGVVAGASTRQGSVAAGLAALLPSVRTVLVHDAARALTPAQQFDRVIDAVETTGLGAVPVLPVVDTIKRVADGAVVGAVDRAELGAAQTPQGFPRVELAAAYAAADAEFTDDAALFAAAGHRVVAVEGDPRAFKITTADDLRRARALLAAWVADASGAQSAPGRAPASGKQDASPAFRVGIGTDVHAFGGDGPLWLGGLSWPGEPALAGHSDGDAVAHAIVDALLSAAGLGDIGSEFGVDRPEFVGAHAPAFLEHTLTLVRAAGFRIANVSVQVQLRRPRFAPRRAESERVLSAALGGAPVAVSATTTDGLGFTGVGDGVAAYAVALLVTNP